MLMLAVFQLLLARYSGQRDIVVGSAIANRNKPEIENLIGFFVNTLVFRSSLEGDPSFVEFLDRVRDTSLGAYENQDVPFELLVEEVASGRDLSHSPMVQTMFAFQNVGVADLQAEGLQIELYGHGAITTRFDLECYVWLDGNGLGGRFIYNPGPVRRGHDGGHVPPPPRSPRERRGGPERSALAAQHAGRHREGGVARGLGGFGARLPAGRQRRRVVRGSGGADTRGCRCALRRRGADLRAASRACAEGGRRAARTRRSPRRRRGVVL